jgi:hypothetical protein
MPNNQNNILYLLLAFAAGCMVGANWPQIKTKLAPLFNTGVDKFGDIYAQLAQMIGEQKEAFDDHRAEKKAGPGKKGNGATQAEFIANIAQMMAGGANQADVIANLSQMMANADNGVKPNRKAKSRSSSPRKRTAAKTASPQTA